MLRIARPALSVLVLSLLMTVSLGAQTAVYYLKGAPTDQASKVSNDTVSATIGTATFDRTAPTGTAPVTQTGSPFTNEDYVGNPLGIYWSGSFSGTVSGVLDLQWYWSTPNAETVALGGAVQVSVFADPDYAADRAQPGRLIGRAIEAGEPSMGVNTTSGNVFLQSYATTFRVQFTVSCPTSPASTWTATQSAITGQTSLDPILYTDQSTGRTFVSQLLLAGSALAFTDDDGTTWLPSHGSGIGSGIDHQTLCGGPFHRPLLGGVLYPTAVYYCSHDIALANCAISLDGGLTFGPAVPIYTSQQCGGLHGHLKVGPDGTAYVPNKDCGSQQAVVVSEDNGATWSVRKVPNSMAANSDPSVAISKGGRVYLGFADNDNHPVVAVSNDRGNSWTNVKDVGASAGINNTVFSEMVAGDDDRAAMAFVGTTSPGSLQDRTLPDA